MTTDQLIAELKRRGHFPLLILSQDDIADECDTTSERAQAAWYYIGQEYDSDGSASREVMQWARELIEEGVV